MERAAEKVRQAPGNIKGIPKTEYDGGWYQVNVDNERSDSTLTLIIVSEGIYGKQQVEQKKKIVLAVREILDKKIVRASPHFFNSEAEIQKVVDEIRKL